MAAVVETMQIHLDAAQDEAFLSLLSSQREMLNRLNMENAVRRAEQHNAYGRNNRLVANAPVPTNRSIVDRRSSMDMLLSKRFSLGLGLDQYVLPTFPMEGAERRLSCFDDHVMYPESSGKKRDKLDTDDDLGELKGKKRRLSSMGFFSATFFEDNLKPVRRDSMLSIATPIPIKLEESENKDSVADNGSDHSDDEDDGDEKDDASIEPLGLHNEDKIVVVAADLDPEKFKVIMEAFTTAMETSQKSQQDIHDWDRKMGLKRSHSKTMRLSSRSRKKLTNVLRKEMKSMTAIKPSEQ